MAEKGVNTLIIETKNNLTNAINDSIKTGIPPAMISIMLESLLLDLNSNVKNIINKEKLEYEKELESEPESNQILYESEQKEEVL